MLLATVSVRRLASCCMLWLSLFPLTTAHFQDYGCISLEGDAPLTIRDVDGPKSFRLKLSKVPTSPVTVTLSSLHLTFDYCTIVFSPANWNVYQTVQMIPALGQSSNNISTSIELRFQSNDACNCKVATIPVSRTASPSGSCSSTGDPHYSSFRAAKYSHQVPGTYYLINSPDLDVMVVTETCGKTVSCNSAVAVRYGQSTVVMDFRNRSSLDSDFKTLSSNTDGLNLYTKGIQYLVELPDNTIISAAPFTSLSATRKTSWVNVAITASNKYAFLAKGGMCYTDAQKRIVPKTGNFTGTSDAAKSWIVPDEANIFLGNFIPSNVSICSAFYDCPVITPCCEEKPAIPPTTTTTRSRTTTTTRSRTSTTTRSTTSTTTRSTTSTTTRSRTSTTTRSTTARTTTTVPATTTTPSPTPTSSPDCEELPCDVVQYCEKMFRMPDTCNRLLSPDQFIDNCIADKLASSKNSFSQSHHVSYLIECERLTHHGSKSNNATLRDLSKKIIKAARFKDVPNLNSAQLCSNNGRLTETGCSCDLGWGGLTCQLNLKENTCPKK